MKIILESELEKCAWEIMMIAHHKWKRNYGGLLSTSCFSFGYVSAWAKGDSEKLIKLGNDIQKAAEELISRVEGAQKKSKVA
jgi:hypothetical protein